MNRTRSVPRPPGVWAVLLFASIVCALLQGCSSSAKPAPRGVEWIELSSKRLAHAIRSIERVRTNPKSRAEAAAYRARIDAVRRLRDDLQASLQGGEQRGPGRERALAMLAAAERRLEELTRDAEEHTLRGSVQGYALQAELEWEVERLKELARRTGRAAEVVPENLFTLLSEPILRELHERWSDNLNDLQKAAASAPPGTHRRAIEEAQAKIVEIERALEAPGVDLVARFFHANKQPDIEPPTLQWLAERESSREKEIRDRTQSLLIIENAKDGTDVAVLMEIRKLLGSGPEGHAAGRRALVMKRSRGFQLPSSSGAVRDLIRNRFADPLEAVRAEAALMLQWHELKAVDPSRRHLLLPEELERSFTDWMVSHLSDDDLVEAKAYLDEARAALRATDLAVPIMMQGRLDVDRQIVESEAAALERELAHRRTAGRPRAPPLSDSLSDAERAMLARHAWPTSPTAAGSRAERRALVEALRRYEARTNPKAEAKRMRVELEIRGYADEVERLALDGRRIAELPDAVARQKAEALQMQRAARLRQGLAKLYALRPEEVRPLLDQINETVGAAPRDAPVDRADGDSEGTDPGVWQGFPAFAISHAALGRGFRADARPYGDIVLDRIAVELESIPGLDAAPDRPSANAPADVVQFSTLLAERRRAGVEHPLVAAVNAADKPRGSPADDPATRSAGSDGSDQAPRKPSDGSEPKRPSDQDGANEAAPARRDGPGRPRQPSSRPGKRR